MRRAAVALLMLLTVGAVSGCLAVAAGAGTGAAVAYSMGRLQANVTGSLDQTAAAAEKAVAQLGFAKVSATKDALNAKILARTAMDKKVEIDLATVSSTTTAVNIRVGVFGDEKTSLMLLEKIKANL